MTECSTLNVKLPNSQLNKLKFGIKYGSEVTLNLLSNLIGSSNDETKFPHQLLLTDTQVSKICKAFANGLSPNIKCSKTQFSKMLQLGEFLFSSSGISDLPMAPIKGFFSLANSAIKESKYMGAKKINNAVL